MIEAEIKARLVDPAEVRRRLEQQAAGTPEIYSDTYFDTPDAALASHERELRVRTIAELLTWCSCSTPRADRAARAWRS